MSAEEYVVLDRLNQTWATRENAEEAYRLMDRYAKENPNVRLRVVRLVPVPRPAPPRPTKVIANHTVEVRGNLLYSPLTQMDFPVSETRNILAAADLIRETEAWEREHGGAA